MSDTPTYEQLSALCAQMAAALEESNTLLGSMPIYKENPRCVAAITANRQALTAYRTLSPDPQWQRVPEGCVVISKEKLWLWRCMIGETDYIRARRVAGELDAILGTDWNSEYPNPLETHVLVPRIPSEEAIAVAWQTVDSDRVSELDVEKILRAGVEVAQRARGEG